MSGERQLPGRLSTAVSIQLHACDARGGQALARSSEPSALAYDPKCQTAYGALVATDGLVVRELDTTLQQFAEFLLKARLVKEHAAPYCARWVRQFLTRPAADEPLADRIRRFCEQLERDGCQDWQVQQAGAGRSHLLRQLPPADRWPMPTRQCPDR